MSANSDRVAAMTTLLTSLTPTNWYWQWIGRTAYLRTTRGVFRLDIDNGGTYEAVVGLSGVFMPFVGGEPDRITFRFGDFIVSTNPTNNPHYRGEAVSSNTRDWTWYIARPESVAPFQRAISAWVKIHEGP